MKKRPPPFFHVTVPHSLPPMWPGYDSPSYSPTSPSYCPTTPSYMPPPTTPKNLPKASSPPPSPSPTSPTSAISPPSTKRARFSIDDGERNADGGMTATSSGEIPLLLLPPPPPRMEVIECLNCKKKGHEAVDCRAYVKEGYRRYGICSDKDLHA